MFTLRLFLGSTCRAFWAIWTWRGCACFSLGRKEGSEGSEVKEVKEVKEGRSEGRMEVKGGWK
jgi:hypothetical protein